MLKLVPMLGKPGMTPLTFFLGGENVNGGIPQAHAFLTGDSSVYKSIIIINAPPLTPPEG